MMLRQPFSQTMRVRVDDVTVAARESNEREPACSAMRIARAVGAETAAMM